GGGRRLPRGERREVRRERPHLRAGRRVEERRPSGRVAPQQERVVVRERERPREGEGAVERPELPALGVEEPHAAVRAGRGETAVLRDGQRDDASFTPADG